MSLKGTLEKIELKNKRYHKWLKKCRNKWLRRQKIPMLKFRKGWEL